MAKDDALRQIWLLLLPCLPSEISLNTLKVAYRPGLTQAIKQAAQASDGSSNVILDIAIACEDGSVFEYSRLQGFFGLMYRLICIVCTENQIDIQYGNDVDARLVLFRHTQYLITAPAKSHFSITDLENLAKTNREWQRIFSLDGEDAESLLQDFIRLRNLSSQHTVQGAQVERLPGGLIVRQSPTKGAMVQGNMFRRYQSVAVGGTFDHLHAGHKLLLTMTALALDSEATEGSCITVGITGDELLRKKKYQEELEDFFKRQSAVHFFLLGILDLMCPNHILGETQDIKGPESIGREVHDILKSGLTIKYVEIFDPCGPTITDEAISALVLSAETRSGGQAVNDKRRDKGWSPLDVLEVDVLDAGDEETSQTDDSFRSKISSTDIRRRVQQKSAPASEKY